MNDLLSVINRFQSLGTKYGRNKTTSYQVILYFSPCEDEEVRVELGGYDIGNWNRHHEFETTKSKLVEELTKYVEEAEKILKEEQYE